MAIIVKTNKVKKNYTINENVSDAIMLLARELDMTASEIVQLSMKETIKDNARLLVNIFLKERIELFYIEEQGLDEIIVYGDDDNMFMCRMIDGNIVTAFREYDQLDERTFILSDEGYYLSNTGVNILTYVMYLENLKYNIPLSKATAEHYCK